MTDVQFDELRSLLLDMLTPVRDLARSQLAAMNPAQMPATTRTLIGTDATRDEANGVIEPTAQTAPHLQDNPHEVAQPIEPEESQSEG